MLYFPGNAAKLHVDDVPLASGLAENQSTTLQLNVKQGTALKVVLTWTDPAGVPLVNDLDLRVTDPAGSLMFGNGQPDHVNNVEVVSIPQPPAGTYTITISASHLGAGPRQGYALVVSGDISDAPSHPSRTRAVRH